MFPTSRIAFFSLLMTAVILPAARGQTIVLSDSFDRMAGSLGDPGQIPPDIGESDWGMTDNAAGGTAPSSNYIVVSDAVNPNQEITDGQYGVINFGRTILDYNFGTDANVLTANGLRISMDVNPSDVGNEAGGGFNGRDWLGFLLADTNSTSAIGGSAALFSTGNLDARVGVGPRNSGTAITRRGSANVKADGNPDGGITEPVFDAAAWSDYQAHIANNGGDPNDVPGFENPGWYTIELVVKRAPGTGVLFDDNAEHLLEIYAGPQGGSLSRLDPDVSTPGIIEESFFWGDNQQTVGAGSPVDPTPAVRDAYLVFVANGQPHLFDNLVVTAFSESGDNADFNGDTIVNGADLLVWQRGFGIPSGATLGQGDADGNGAVDDSDLAIWQTQFGQGAPLVAVAQGVPEPASLTLWTLAAGAAGVVRRRMG